MTLCSLELLVLAGSSRVSWRSRATGLFGTSQKVAWIRYIIDGKWAIWAILQTNYSQGIHLSTSRAS
jgi:hypothetical protein